MCYNVKRNVHECEPNPWNHLQLHVAKSRHQGAKPFRRCGLLKKISLFLYYWFGVGKALFSYII
jgi:hypothetical protein